MFLHDTPLIETAAALRSGELDLLTYMNNTCDRIEVEVPHIQALLPEEGRRARLLAGAQAL